MRMMLTFTFPTTAETNAWIRDGSIGQKMESILGELQPEAAYFSTIDGTRGGYLVFNMDEASEMPSKVEPLFQELGAGVQIFPVMTPEDLRTGLQQM